MTPVQPEPEKVFYPFEQFAADICKLVSAIKQLEEERGRPFKKIYTPIRGGGVGAICLSYALSPPDKPEEEVEIIFFKKSQPPTDYDPDGFIYDDIADTGKTLGKCVALGMPILTLFHTEWCSYQPTVSLRKKQENTWIDFWWEKFGLLAKAQKTDAPKLIPPTRCQGPWED